MSDNAPPTLYNYDSRTGLLTSVSEADPDPMRPGQWLHPAHSTLLAPPTAPDGDVAVFTLVHPQTGSPNWRVMPDDRGTWYNAQGEAVQIDDVQADVSALVRDAPPSPDHELTNGQWQLSSAKVEARFQAAKASLLTQARSQREIVLNRLLGIGFAAKETGNAPIVAACMTTRQSLLDLTKHASITGATTEAQLKAAYKNLYGAIVAATPIDIRSVYSDIQV